MKRFLSLTMMLMILVPGAFAEQDRDSYKAFKKARAMKASFSTEVAPVSVDQSQGKKNKAVKPLPNLGKTKVKPKTRLEFAKKKGVKPVNSLTKGDLDFSFDGMGKDTLFYTIGDQIGFVVMSSELLMFEFFLDDGDMVFDETSDFLMGDPNEPIMGQDGEEPDMDPAAGVWAHNMPTDVMLDGPFFGIENVLIYIRATEVGTGASDTLYAFSMPVESELVIGGNVDVGGSMPANVLVLAVSVPDSMWFKSPGDSGFMAMPPIAYAAFTDEFGDYVIHVDSANASMEYEVFPEDVMMNYPGYFSDPPMAISTPGFENYTVDFSYTMGNSSIAGSLVDELGNGIPGVEVFAFSWNYEVVDTTDENGDFYFALTMDDWYIDANPMDLIGDYLVPEGVNVWMLDGDKDTTVTLMTYAADGTISGNVSTSSGTPKVDVDVEAYTWDGERSYWTFTRTDEFGDYVVDVASALDPVEVCEDSNWCWMDGGYWVEPWFKEWNIMYDGVLEPPYASGQTGVDFIVYDADAMLYGWVSNAETFAPIYDAYIHVYTPNDDTMDVKSGMYFENGTYSDENGYYELPLLSGTDFIIEVYHPNNWMIPAAVDQINLPAGDTQRDFGILPPKTKGSLSGFVRDENGTGLGDLQVEIDGWTWDNRNFKKVTRTKADGKYEFIDVPFGEYDVRVFTADGNVAEKWVWLGPGSANPVVDFNLGIDDRNMISGMVYDDSGSPLTDVLVQAYSYYNDMAYHFFTDDSGYYELFVEEGDYSVYAGMPGYFKVEEYRFVDGPVELDFMLEAVPGGDLVSISGAVYDDATGTGVFDAMVYVETFDYLTWAYTDAAGNYDVKVLPDWYDIYVGHPDYYEGWYYEEFTADQSDVDFYLWPMEYQEEFWLDAVYDKADDHGGRLWVDWEPYQPSNYDQVERYVVSWKHENDMFWRVGEEVPLDVFSEEQWMYHYEAKVGTNMEVEVQVVALGRDNWYYSDILTGQAQDNLPPMVPNGGKMNEMPEGIMLSWNPENIEPIMYYHIEKSVNGGEWTWLANTTDTEYLDEGELIEGDLAYRIVAHDFSENLSDPAEMTMMVTSLDENIPTEFALKQNYPNPFNPTTTISFGIPEQSAVSLVIYDALGNTVRTLVSSNLNAGEYSYVWNGLDQNARQVSSGVYFYKMTAGDMVMLKKMILMR